MMTTTRRFAFALALLLCASPSWAQTQTRTKAQIPAASVVGAPQGQPLSGTQLDVRTKEVASLVRCPVCQGLSVYDSPATMAVNMRHEVRDLLSKGYTEEQILTYFEKSYGEFVLLQPTMRGANWIVWLAPLALLALGGFILRGVFRKKAVPVEQDRPVTDRDQLPDDPRLARYVLEARELAYGWPGGVSPDHRA